MSVSGAGNQITQSVLSWAGVSAHPHRFGGTEYQLGTREIGHIHGDHLVDIPFPTKVRNEVVAAGQAEPHHLLHDSGWISFYLRQPGDVEGALSLLHRSYTIAFQQQQKRNAQAPLSPTDSASALE
ncbi:MAG: DUF5519 family protein [Chloroflexota bacterium]|nr:DUF5519 family protein [Chloroflexota bacterium]